MRLVFHIGMGKTGTTALQKALASAEASGMLARQGAHYLGMWFGMIDPAFGDFAGTQRFLMTPPQEMPRHAEAFAAALGSRPGGGDPLFILSNEAMFQHADRLGPFFSALQAGGADLRLIAWVRDPADWLPSAYAQWAIRHKTYPGPIQPLAARAEALLSQYRPIGKWADLFGEALVLRRYDPDADIAADFAAATGIDLPAAPRALERPEPAELLLRALFNDRFADPALPDRFNSAVLSHPAPSVDEMAARIFGSEGAAEVLARSADLLDDLAERHGLDFRGAGAAPPPPPDPEALRARLFDHLVEIVLSQAIRIRRLETRIAELAPPKRKP